MAKFTYNQCKVCGGDLTHNQATNKYICKYCGNEYTLNENNVLQQITKQDLDEQRTKIVDDIKDVFNDVTGKISAIQEEQKTEKKLIETSKKKVKKSKKRAIILWIIVMILTSYAIYRIVGLMSTGSFQQSHYENLVENNEIFECSLQGNNEVIITGLKDKTTIRIEIPDYISGKPVTSIQYGAFDDCVYLQEVIIGANVYDIGQFAFSGCPLVFVEFSCKIGWKINNETSIDLTHKNNSEIALLLSETFVGCYWYNSELEMSFQ